MNAPGEISAVRGETPASATAQSFRWARDAPSAPKDLAGRGVFAARSDRAFFERAHITPHRSIGQIHLAGRAVVVAQP